jgi:hypothetical protein
VTGVVAPSPRARRPAPPRFDPLPPVSRGRRPPPPSYLTAAHRRRRRLPVLVLLMTTVIAGGYFLSTRGGTSPSSSSATDFVSVTRRLATSARSLPPAAENVQRFTELHQFDVVALATIARIDQDRDLLIKFAGTQTGSARTIADQATNAANQAADAAANYREAVAFTYRLSNAQSAAQDLMSAAATLDAQAQAWSTH